jgi:RimK family alpha-L-glutamate ligase
MNITLITSIKEGSENHRLQEEATNLGHTLTIVDPTTITVSIQDNQLHYPEISQTNPDIVILRGVLHAIKKTVAIIEHLRLEGVRVFDNNLSQMQYSINKISDLSKLALRGISLPNTRLSPYFDHFPKLATEIGYPVIIKPINTGKGLGISKVSNPEELKTLIEDRKSNQFPAKNLIIQQFIPYIHDLRILVIGHHTFCMERTPQEGEFRANYSLGGTVKPFDLSETTRENAIDALESIDMSVAGVDILITENGQEYILEVNHSPGFEGMEKAINQNIAKTFLEHALSHAK